MAKKKRIYYAVKKIEITNESEIYTRSLPTFDIGQLEISENIEPIPMTGQIKLYEDMMKEEIKAGDKVIVLDNICCASHPTENRSIVAGDIIIVREVVQAEFSTLKPGLQFGRFALYDVVTDPICSDKNGKEYKGNYIPVIHLERIAEAAVVAIKDSCTCSIMDLMIRGCQCNQFQKEMAAKAQGA